MSPLSAPVLGGAAVVTAPALWRAIAEGGSPTVALSRYLIAMALVWLALEVVSLLVGPAPAPVHADGATDSTAEDAGADAGVPQG
jgi:hypothetical protein